ncbi:MAG TPA: hypothetical protein VFW23_07205 [Tepidisphaeraceae bacterium]|nr:hypothetical protein [Tepidisphaeraceae bacterium]
MLSARYVLAIIFIASILPLRAAAEATEKDLYRFGYNPRSDFLAFDPHYREGHDRFSKELDALQADMIRQQRAGRKTFCSRQVFLECRWLVYYTDDQPRTRQRLDDLRKILALKSDPHDREQDKTDGSFAPCCNAWWLRMDMTCDELITMSFRWRSPKYAVTLLNRINSPQKLRQYFDSLLISDIRKTGINNALELNMSAADLQRFILYDGTLRELPTKFDFDPGLKAALLDFEDNTWQDPVTGMWGAWYRAADGSIVKTADLSTTFHLVNYRNAKSVKRWPQIFQTTLAMKTGRFPFGWLEEGKYMSNHHNMDIVTLWRLGWPEATAEQHTQIANAISEMLDFCLKQSLQPDGSFKSPEEDTLSSAFYFGVGFLHEIGYFTKTNRFWTDRAFPEAQATRKRIANRITQLKLDDSEATWALGMLRLDKE